MLYAILGVLAIILDQWVKYWAAGNLTYGGEAKTLIPGVIDLLNVHNDGAAFSFLSGANAGKLFIILAIVFAVLVVVGLITNFISGKLARWSAVFVAAGGIGNAIDRALYGYVQDMFQFSFFKSFPVFNVADIFICVFCLIFIFCILFGGKSAVEGEDDIEYYEDEEEEEEEPRRRRFAKRSADEFEMDETPVRSRRSGRRERDIDEDYEEEPAPQKRAAPHKERRALSEDDYDQYSTRRRFDEEETVTARRNPSARDEAEGPVRRKPAPRTQEDNPFAEWEAATAADSRRSSPAKPARNAYDDAYETRPRTPAKPVQQPAKPAAPVAPAKPAAPARSSSGDFDLDDILAEFK